MAGAGLTAQIADCLIKLEQGDITRQPAKAIVNSVCGGDKLGGGECNTAITKAAGASIEAEYKANNTGSLDLVMTNAGNLEQEKIFHVVAKNDPAVLKDVVERTLKMAEVEEMASIAFPALGTGHMGGDAKKLAVPIFEAMRDFALEDRPIVLHNFKLVIFKAELFDIYKEAMQETLDRYIMVD